MESDTPQSMELSFVDNLYERMIVQTSVPLQVILHNTFPKVQQRYVIIDTTIQNPGILHEHINSLCLYWPPPLFTTNSYPVCIAIQIHLVGPSHKFAVQLDDVSTVEAMETTLLSFQRNKKESSFKIFTEAIYIHVVWKFLPIRFSLIVPVPPWQRNFKRFRRLKLVKRVSKYIG